MTPTYVPTEVKTLQLCFRKNTGLNFVKAHESIEQLPKYFSSIFLSFVYIQSSFFTENSFKV